MTTKTFAARFTTLFQDSKTPQFSGAFRQMTADQVREEYADLKRGGTFVGVEINGAPYPTMDLDELGDE